METKLEGSLSKLNIWQLKEILKSLRLYKDLLAKLWNRGRDLFFSKIFEKNIYKVEYFESVWEKEALIEALKAYNKIFWISPSKEDIILKPKNSLEGWIRIHKDDCMADLSFKKLEKFIR